MAMFRSSIPRRVKLVMSNVPLAPSVVSMARASFHTTGVLNSPQSHLPLTGLTAVSSIDGRYGKGSSPLRSELSEFALIKYRIQVELAWLRILASTPEITDVPQLSEPIEGEFKRIVESFDLTQAMRVKEIEATTNHDVKAVEYYLKEQFAASSVRDIANIQEFLHFAATSEDVNNLAYALMVKSAQESVLIPSMHQLIGKIVDMAERLSSIPMLSRTHGQPATPTTMGKEWANFAYRLSRQVRDLSSVEILGKWNGAVGNYNAHAEAYPNVNWEEVCSIDFYSVYTVSCFLSCLSAVQKAYCSRVRAGI